MYEQHIYAHRNHITEMALAAIYLVLFPNALQGWEEWSAYAAAGGWQ